MVGHCVSGQDNATLVSDISEEATGHGVRVQKKKTYMTEGTTVRYKFESKMRSAVGDTKGRRADLIMPG